MARTSSPLATFSLLRKTGIDLEDARKAMNTRIVAVVREMTGQNKTLLDAYQDVRDKYACRTVFKNGDYTKHPEIVKILEEGNYSDAAYRKAQLRAAEIQSQPAVDMLKEAMRKAVREGKDL